jgi:hypothetical protein
VPAEKVFRTRELVDDGVGSAPSVAFTFVEVRFYDTSASSDGFGNGP